MAFPKEAAAGLVAMTVFLQVINIITTTVSAPWSTCHGFDFRMRWSLEWVQMVYPVFFEMKFRENSYYGWAEMHLYHLRKLMTVFTFIQCTAILSMLVGLMALAFALNYTFARSGRQQHLNFAVFALGLDACLRFIGWMMYVLAALPNEEAAGNLALAHFRCGHHTWEWGLIGTLLEIMLLTLCAGLVSALSFGSYEPESQRPYFQQPMVRPPAVQMMSYQPNVAFRPPSPRPGAPLAQPYWPQHYQPQGHW